MIKFSKINESLKFDKSDIETVNDILLDFSDNPKFDIKLDYMGINGLIYGKEIPDYINNFNWFNIRILYKNISNTDEFLEEYKFFNENVLNIISHLESLGKVFFKINTEYDREYLNERNKDENFTYKNIHINLQSNIKVFPN